MFSERLQSVQEKAQMMKEMLFDQEEIEVPDKIAGVKSDSALELSKHIFGLSSLFETGKISANTSPIIIKAALVAYPLLKKAMQEEVTTEDVRPYRSALKTLQSGAGCASCTLGCLSVFPPLWILTIPVTIKLNEKIESGFVDQAPQLRETMKTAIHTYLPRVLRLTEFENPKSQWFHERVTLRERIMNHDQGLEERVKVPEEEGQLFVGKAGEALHSGFADLIHSPRDYPLTHRLLSVAGVKPYYPRLPKASQLALAAPELIRAFADHWVSGPDMRYSEFLLLNKDPLRTIPGAEWLNSSKLQALREHLPGLIEALATILPEDGASWRKKLLAEANEFGVTEDQLV
ncbi:hypothetical protein HY468_01265 [Candidatus Roizmanbacteria bacterium]|nr:hypothetical protein [Candidatus Roizmanbacteria bacterium]